MNYLRDYQIAARDSIIRELSNGSTSTLAVLPTGTGKTEMALDLIDHWPDASCGVLWLAHMVELIDQPWNRWNKKTGEYAELIQGERRRSASNRSRMHFASKDSLHPDRLKKEFPDPNEIGLVVVDECHHCVSSAKSYAHVLDYFRQNKDMRIMGMTATPDRQDEVALGSIFDSVAYDYPLFHPTEPSAIGDGWLVPIDQRYVTVEELEFEAVDVRGGDFAEGSLARMVEQNKALEKMTAETRARATGRSVLCFVAGINNAVHQAVIFNAENPGSAYVIASRRPDNCDYSFFIDSSDYDARARMFRKFTKQEFQFLCNVGIVTEGTDVPSVSCVSMGRPTKSRSLYAQMAGRVLRVLPGVIEGDGWRIDDPQERKDKIAASAKPNALILDFVGNSKHGLMSSVDILGGVYPDEVVEIAKTRLAGGGDPVDELIAAEEEHRENMLAIERRRQLKVTTRSSERAIDPFAMFGVVSLREPGWHKGRMPTAKQLATLRKFKIPDRELENLSFWKASKLLDKLIASAKNHGATYKQRLLLTKHRFDPDVSFDEASATIDRIAKSGWALKGE